MPVEYWRGIPPELEARVRKLADEREIVEEMHVFAAEELNLRNLEARRAMNSMPAQTPAKSAGQKPKAAVSPEAEQERMALEIIRQRRSLLDQQPVTRAPRQIEIVPSLPQNIAPQNTPNLPLTPPSERQINPVVTGDRKT